MRSARGVKLVLFTLALVALWTGAALAAPTLRAVGEIRPTIADTVPPPAPASSVLPVPSPDPAAIVAVPAPAPLDGPVNGVAFRISIPAIGYQATVLEGVDLDVLSRGPGHYPTTAWPGRPGNVGVAGHNSFWIDFGRLKSGDQILITTAHAAFTYEVTGCKVVTPDDRTVLASTPDQRLTLTTCYPLWAGAFATRRLVVTAIEIGGVA
jgi:LPXTG-site transpeptidase (sortase) family protein